MLITRCSPYRTKSLSAFSRDSLQSCLPCHCRPTRWSKYFPSSSLSILSIRSWYPMRMRPISLSRTQSILLCMLLLWPISGTSITGHTRVLYLSILTTRYGKLMAMRLRRKSMNIGIMTIMRMMLKESLFSSEHMSPARFSCSMISSL